jgi:hypothetical protein
MMLVFGRKHGDCIGSSAASRLETMTSGSSRTVEDDNFARRSLRMLLQCAGASVAFVTPNDSLHRVYSNIGASALGMTQSIPALIEKNKVSNLQTVIMRVQ